MSMIDTSINWTGSETTKVEIAQSISIPKEEARQRAGALQNQISAFISQAMELYKGAPTSELSGVILMGENIERELEKLK